MIRILVDRLFEGGKHYIEGACVAADVDGLPTTGIITGSKMEIADTGDEYTFAEGDSPAWNKTKSGPTVEDG